MTETSTTSRTFGVDFVVPSSPWPLSIRDNAVLLRQRLAEDVPFPVFAQAVQGCRTAQEVGDRLGISAHDVNWRLRLLDSHEWAEIEAVIVVPPEPPC